MPIRPTNDRSETPEMMELFQAEWCPASRRVRELLTELDVSYVIRQVPVDRADRDALFAVAASRVIPTLVLEDGTALIDEDEIRAWLGAHVPSPAGASRPGKGRDACATSRSSARATNGARSAPPLTPRTWRSPDDNPEDDAPGSGATSSLGGVAARADPLRHGGHRDARVGRPRRDAQAVVARC